MQLKVVDLTHMDGLELERFKKAVDNFDKDFLGTDVTLRKMTKSGYYVGEKIRIGELEKIWIEDNSIYVSLNLDDDYSNKNIYVSLEVGYITSDESGEIDIILYPTEIIFAQKSD